MKPSVRDSSGPSSFSSDGPSLVAPTSDPTPVANAGTLKPSQSPILTASPTAQGTVVSPFPTFCGEGKSSGKGESFFSRRRLSSLLFRTTQGHLPEGCDPPHHNNINMK